MENVVGVEDALQAHMKDKKYLDELSLNWSRGLLSNCGNCSTLPPLGQLPCLEHIKISEMSGVVRVGSEYVNWEKWLCCGVRHGEFPRLQELSITSQTSEIEISDVSQLKQLPVVPHNLYIRKCDSVESPSKVGLPTTLRSLSISDFSRVDLLLPELFRCHHPVLENLSINGGTCDSLSLSFSILDIFPEDCPELLLHREGLPSNLRNLKYGPATNSRHSWTGICKD
ncbi:hypothetical protein AAG906_025618 [Vitis piasezkii]